MVFDRELSIKNKDTENLQFYSCIFHVGTYKKRKIYCGNLNATQRHFLYLKKKNINLEIVKTKKKKIAIFFFQSTINVFNVIFIDRKLPTFFF